MQLPVAVNALSALAHGHRLTVFRMLVRAGPAGLAAGAIAREAGLPSSTLSSHLSILDHAGLIRARREGRSILYAADHAAMGALLDFLIADCCGGHPEICGPIGADLAGCGA